MDKEYELLVQAVILARGNDFILSAPELADPEHALSLLNLAVTIQEADLE